MIIDTTNGANTADVAAAKIDVGDAEASDKEDTKEDVQKPNQSSTKKEECAFSSIEVIPEDN